MTTDLVTARDVAPDAVALTTWMDIPGLGMLADNAFLVRAREPLLVDTGVRHAADALVERLGALIDPADLRWIWLTHADADHLGALRSILDLAPRARVATSFVGFAKLGLLGYELPPERVHLINPGQRLSLGDREVVAVRPPTFDAPETQGLQDARTGVLFSSDSFGGVLPEPADDAAAIHPTVLRDGVVRWTTLDAPWLHGADRGALATALDAVRRLDPTVVLSTHLPPARGLTDRLLAHLAAARDAAPFVGPDQAAFAALAAK